MSDRLHKLVLILWATTLTAPLWAQGESASPSAPGGAQPGEPGSMSQWLDEVRAQRQAWEERRRAAKEALDARRRWIDPWGAAQKEARDKETQRRREAFREHIERDREVFRHYSPWGSQSIPWEEIPPGAERPSPDAASPPEGRMTAPPEGVIPPSPYPPLPGWDNRWYYRGY